LTCKDGDSYISGFLSPEKIHKDGDLYRKSISLFNFQKLYINTSRSIIPIHFPIKFPTNRHQLKSIFVLFLKNHEVMHTYRCDGEGIWASPFSCPGGVHRWEER
jgi:hypothetical protein